MNRAYIEAFAHYEAPNVMTSDWIEEQLAETLERLEIRPGVLEKLTGIKERRFWEHETTYYDTATEAATKVIEKSGIDPQDIEVLINTSICRDYIEPSQACLVHGNLELSPHCLSFDISNACLGFVNGIDLINTMINAGKIQKYALLVTSEGSIKGMENTIKMLQSPDCTMQTYKDNFATMTIGSGAVAMLIANEDIAESQHVINNSVNVTDTANGNNMLCFATPDHSQMYADAQGLVIEGIKLAVETWEKASEVMDKWDDETIDIYIPHQTSTRQMEAFSNSCGLTLDKFHVILEKYGNTASAALPMTLVDAAESGKLNSGDHVAIMGIGSGLNCLMMSVTW